MADEEPAWGAQFIMSLEDAGIVPRWTQRVVIEADLTSFVRVYAELHPKEGDTAQRVIVNSPAMAVAEVQVINGD